MCNLSNHLPIWLQTNMVTNNGLTMIGLLLLPIPLIWTHCLSLSVSYLSTQAILWSLNITSICLLGLKYSVNNVQPFLLNVVCSKAGRKHHIRHKMQSHQRLCEPECSMSYLWLTIYTVSIIGSYIRGTIRLFPNN